VPLFRNTAHDENSMFDLSMSADRPIPRIRDCRLFPPPEDFDTGNSTDPNPRHAIYLDTQLVLSAEQIA
jgi:hypothetical protein